MHGEARGNFSAHGETAVAVDSTSEEVLLLDIPTTCRVLGGITEQELRARMRAGDITKVKIGRRAFALRSSVVAYVDRLVETQTQAVA